MIHILPIRPVVTGLLLAVSATAAEYAVLHTGFRLRAERHEVAGDQIRLFTPDGGTIEVAAAAVHYFETEDFVEPESGVQQPRPAETVDAMIERLGGELGLHPALIHSVVAAESAYNPHAVSSKGAIGLMQLMPDTARELQVSDARDPAQNLRGGTLYLKQLLDRYGGQKDQLVRALAAYNAGPSKVEDYNGLPPYRETAMFVRRVVSRFLDLTDPASTAAPESSSQVSR